MIRRISVVILLITLVFGSILSYSIFSSVNTAKKLQLQMNSGNISGALQSSQDLADKYSRIQSLLNAPLVKQGLQITGLNFSENRDDYQSLIKAAPLLAGVAKSQRYLVAFQNTAEARGTGGILGAFAILKFDKGNFTIEQSGSNAALASLREIPVPVPSEFLNLYGQNPAILQNSNLSPHFPYGAEIWMGLWKRQTGEDLDGVIAVDPTSLSYVLKATGPIKVRGRKIDSDNLVKETLKDAYKRYEYDNKARKQYLVDIIDATAQKLVTGQFSKVKIAKALNRGVTEGRILIYSRDPAAEKLISGTKFGGFLSETLNNEYRVVIQNIDASKLDYYLQKDVEIKNTSCKKPNKTTISVKVTNTLKTGKDLPAYVLTRADKGKPADLVTGQHRFKVFIYGPVGGAIVSAWRENLSYGIGGQAKERMRPVMVMEVDLKPLESEKLQVNFAGGNGDIKYVDQPLVIPTNLKIKGGC